MLDQVPSSWSPWKRDSSLFSLDQVFAVSFGQGGWRRSLALRLEVTTNGSCPQWSKSTHAAACRHWWIITVCPVTGKQPSPVILCQDPTPPSHSMWNDPIEEWGWGCLCLLRVSLSLVQAATLQLIRYLHQIQPQFVNVIALLSLLLFK